MSHWCNLAHKSVVERLIKVFKHHLFLHFICHDISFLHSGRIGLRMSLEAYELSWQTYQIITLSHVL